MPNITDSSITMQDHVKTYVVSFDIVFGLENLVAKLAFVRFLTFFVELDFDVLS